MNRKIKGEPLHDTAGYNTAGGQASAATKRQQAKLQESAEATETLMHMERVQRIGYGIQVMAGPLDAALSNLGNLINEQMVAQGFWESENSGEKFALMHSEISEALEADRKDLPSDHIPDFSGVEEELADTLIRILDFAAFHELRLGEAIVAKMMFNLSRPPKHGKKY